MYVLYYIGVQVRRCVYMRMCMCIWVYVYMCMCVYVYVCVCVCVLCAVTWGTIRCNGACQERIAHLMGVVSDTGLSLSRCVSECDMPGV